MTFVEAAMIMMGGGGGDKLDIQPLNVTVNGKYSAADHGCDGFDPVDVNVPDRYEEGFSAGEKSVTDKIAKLTVTANGTYTKEEGGYEPVEVNVPDRYDEGYTDGCADTEANILNDPSNPTHIAIRKDGYDDGYEFATAAITGDPVTRGNVQISVKVYPYTGEWYTLDDLVSSDGSRYTRTFHNGAVARTFVDGVETRTLINIYSFNNMHDNKYELIKWYVRDYDAKTAALCIFYKSDTAKNGIETNIRSEIYKVFL